MWGAIVAMFRFFSVTLKDYVLDHHHLVMPWFSFFSIPIKKIFVLHDLYLVAVTFFTFFSFQIKNFLWDHRYILLVGSNVKALTREFNILEAKRQDVQKEIEKDEAAMKEPTKEVKGWLKRVEALQPTVETIITDYRNGSYFSNVYSISIRAVDKLREVRQEVEFIKIVKSYTTAALKPPVQSISSVPVVFGRELFESRLEEALNFLKDDISGTLGIFGMGGVGKTTLLKHINNTLERTSSLGFNNAMTCSFCKGLGHSSRSCRRRATVPLPPRRSLHHVPAISPAPPSSSFHFPPLPPSSSTRRTCDCPSPPKQSLQFTSLHHSSPVTLSGLVKHRSPAALLQNSPAPLLPLPPQPSLCSASVTPTPEMFADLCYLRNMAVLFVEGDLLSSRAVEKLLHRLWPCRWTWVARPLGDNSFLMSFPSNAMMEEKCAEPPAVLDGYTFAMQQWTPHHRSTLLPRGFPVWIRLVGLPLFCWSHSAIAAVVQGFGNVVRLHHSTRNRSNLSAAVVKILCHSPRFIPKELDLIIGPLLYKITIDSLYSDLLQLRTRSL